MATSEKANKESANEKPTKKKRTSKKGTSFILSFSIGFIIVALAVAGFLINDGIKVSSSSIVSGYDTTFVSEKDAAYQTYYQQAFDWAEKTYHVSNTAYISIGDMKETQNLEILRVSDVEFITEDSDSNSGNVTAWLEVSGEGVFIINLQTAEFSIDNERHHVLVRIPDPELTHITITNATRKWFTDDWADGSFSEGVDLALKQREEAHLQIQQSLLANQYIFDNAKNVAVSTIKNMVVQFNPDIPDLTVDVEFMD